MVYRVWGYYEKDVELFITVVTNLAALPSTVLAFHQKRFANFVIILCTMTVSILYHVAEVKADRIWGMNAGSWHRLDNIFAILCFQTLFIYFADFKKKSKAEDLIRWTCLALCLFCQEKAPWVVTYTVIPIIFSIACMGLKFLFTRQLPKLIKRNFYIGMSLLVPGVIFFIRGLDDGRDWLRLNHNLWHFFVSVASFFLFQSVEHFDPFKKLA